MFQVAFLYSSIIDAEKLTLQMNWMQIQVSAVFHCKNGAAAFFFHLLPSLQNEASQPFFRRTVA